MKSRLPMLILVVTIALFAGFPALAEESGIEENAPIDNAPVIGEFQYDPEIAALIKQKEALAEAYYRAKTKGNLQLATMYLRQFEQFNQNAKTFNETGQVIVPTDASRRLAIYQRPQETDFWCGYAAMQSLLDYEGVIKTQAQIADEVYDQSEPCPWYLAHGDSWDQFPVPVHLTEWTDFFYVPYPYGPAGATDVTADDVKLRVTLTIDASHGCMACGASKPNHPSYLPGYPSREIRHWLAVDGYKSYGNEIWIVDPAKSDVISWSDNISAYYSITAEKCAAFVQPRGIVW